MAERKMAWRSLILFKCNTAWNRYIDERCHITWTNDISAGMQTSFQTFRISVRVYQTGSSIDLSYDRSGPNKPRPREENNSPLGERTLPRCFLSLLRDRRLRFPRFPTCILFLFFARLFFPQEREETWRWELKLRNRSLKSRPVPLDSLNLHDTFLLRFFLFGILCWVPQWFLSL